MMNTYENVAGISAKMLEAARLGDWELLKTLEDACNEQIGLLKTSPQSVPLSPQQREHKVRLIRGILENDRRIREITDPWMSKLATMMQSSSTERKLKLAYGS